MKKLDILAEKLSDSRSKRVLFVSHCLLNVNARYLGGAFRQGCVDEIVERAMREGIGIAQMPCPERLAWGGVLKKAMWLAFGSKGKPVYALRRLLCPLFTLYTRLRYRSVAASAAREVADYVRSGYRIEGMIGVDGSPSCGINTRLGMKKSFDYFAACDLDNLGREEFNRGLYDRCSESGSGIFIEEIKRQLKKRKLDIPFFSHSLISEMNGETCEIKFES